MSETAQRLSKSCTSIAVVVLIFLIVLLLIGAGVVIYSIRAGNL